MEPHQQHQHHPLPFSSHHNKSGIPVLPNPTLNQQQPSSASLTSPISSSAASAPRPQHQPQLPQQQHNQSQYHHHHNHHHQSHTIQHPTHPQSLQLQPNSVNFGLKLLLNAAEGTGRIPSIPTIPLISTGTTSTPPQLQGVPASLPSPSSTVSPSSTSTGSSLTSMPPSQRLQHPPLHPSATTSSSSSLSRRPSTEEQHHRVVPSSPSANTSATYVSPSMPCSQPQTLPSPNLPASHPSRHITRTWSTPSSAPLPSTSTTTSAPVLPYPTSTAPTSASAASRSHSAVVVAPVPVLASAADPPNSITIPTTTTNTERRPIQQAPPQQSPPRTQPRQLQQPEVKHEPETNGYGGSASSGTTVSSGGKRPAPKSIGSGDEQDDVNEKGNDNIAEKRRKNTGKQVPLISSPLPKQPVTSTLYPLTLSPIHSLPYLKNKKEAARRSRLKKARRLESLESQVHTLETENNDLRVKMAVFESERAAWRSREAELMERIS
ncbi:hypothetical protein HK102_014040, partial [Quaeritorhiza haematococci]